MVRLIFSILLFILSPVALMLPAGCGKSGGNADDAVARVESSDSLPQGVKSFVRVVAENDTAGFANLVSYPLPRPYPLHDIETPEQMKSYYDVLVDDSLRNAVKNAGPDKWEEFGWRGWTMSGGDYVWIDDSVYDVAYVSGRERVMRDSLASLEMESVDREMRPGWRPEVCLVRADSSAVYRIDVHKEESGRNIYRMAIYRTERRNDSVDADSRRLGGRPDHTLKGYKEVEGTAGTPVYFFTGKEGSKALYQAEMPDGGMSRIEFTLPDGSVEEVEVSRAYWLDLVPRLAREHTLSPHSHRDRH